MKNISASSNVTVHDPLYFETRHDAEQFLKEVSSAYNWQIFETEFRNFSIRCDFCGKKLYITGVNP